MKLNNIKPEKGGCMRNSDRMIAHAIIKAQIASDAGKGHDETRLSKTKLGSSKCIKNGYDEKVCHILNAITGICKSKNSIFRFTVYKTDDQNGYPSYITYFSFNLNGNKYQISFHTPLNKGKSLKRYLTNKRTCRWDHRSSYEACEALFQHFFESEC